MKNYTTLIKCYEYFGVTYPDPRDAPWSPQPENAPVVCTLWSENFPSANQEEYWTGTHTTDVIANRKNQERIGHLRSVGRGGEFQSIIVSHLPSGRARFSPGARMELVDFCENSGDFSARKVGK